MIQLVTSFSLFRKLKLYFDLLNWKKLIRTLTVWLHGHYEKYLGLRGKGMSKFVDFDLTIFDYI